MQKSGGSTWVEEEVCKGIVAAGMGLGGSRQGSRGSRHGFRRKCARV